ncbi:MAG: diaminopimelate epimerase [Promethearchaeota archaeon]
MPSISFEQLNFSKYHGLGNDFIIIDNRDEKIPRDAYSGLAKKLCMLHFSIGADGMILIDKSKSHDMKFSYVNSDGSIGEMCGNGIRCFAKYLHDKNIVDKSKTRIRVETLAGTIIPEVHFENDVVTSVTVDMGEPILDRRMIPVAGDGSNKDIPINIDGQELEFTAVSMGNPHAVFFMDEINVEKVLKLGPVVESHEMFPNKVNAEFVKVKAPDEIDMLVYERGCGMTLACGTGACASVVAGTLQGKLEKEKPITVHLQGGDLKITYKNDKVYMNGPATHVFDGILEHFHQDY